MKVFLINGQNALYRFQWVGKNLHAANGQSTGGIHGMLTGMMVIKRRHPGARFVVAWDGIAARQSWRSAIYPDYKKRRDENPSEDLKALREAVLAQMKATKAMLTAVGIPQIEIDELEADDVIGVMADACLRSGWEVVVYSSDKDYQQLMCDGVKILVSASGAFLTENDVRSKFRCGSADLLKVRAFLGDPSDCIPRAVPGVGPVAAARYVAAGVDPSERHFNDLPQSVRLGAQRIEPYWKVLHRNYRLMRIMRNVEDLPSAYTVETVELKEKTLMAGRALQKPPARSEDRYEKVLAMCGEMNLMSVLENRHELWRLGGSK